MPANTNPLSYNEYILQMGVLAVYGVAQVSGVNQFVDAPIQLTVKNMLNYAELRMQRDLDLLASQSSNTYPIGTGVNVFPLPVDDFVTVQTLEVIQAGGATSTMLAVSKEFIQNVYGGLSTPGTPQYFAMYGDNFGG